MRYRSPRASRRGVTLVEMLVAVTLLVLMMTVIVTIFASATGAVSGLQAFQQLDGDLRQLDITIRRDLLGVTARMTPPLDPRHNLGYLEIGENAFADIQQEDTDDYIRFTAKAPEGQPFVGRVWLAPTLTPSVSQPVMVTSDFAEIIYFLRNGNLYRRVLLVAPNRQPSIDGVVKGIGAANLDKFQTSLLSSLTGSLLSWQAVNDLSAHPAPSGAMTAQPIRLNTLGDLTNRHNRFGYSRHADDYVKHTGGSSSAPDGIPDDENTALPDGSGGIVGDGVTDYPPVLYSQIFASGLIGESTPTTRFKNPDNLAFPYMFPGAYSAPDTYTGSLTGNGWLHSTDPTPATAFTGALDQLKRINHSPLETGDSLPLPGSNQTWWGFPTWRETLFPQWNDPYHLIADQNLTPALQQPLGLRVPLANVSPTFTGNINALPPMTPAYRGSPQPFNDGSGSDLFSTAATAASQALWAGSWEDDLIMTGIRSFDIKVYDDSYPGYVDLGWADDTRLHPATTPTPAGTLPTGTVILAQGNGAMFLNQTPNWIYWNTSVFPTLSHTFAHEGRMPPRVNDNRFDAQYPSFNVGDNQNSIQRLRRVWDTWSTDYSRSPATAFNPQTKLPVGPPWSQPVYPSYPPPYPAAMRGIQIQIRVADPRGERVKTLTIRQDFSDKL